MPLQYTGGRCAAAAQVFLRVGGEIFCAFYVDKAVQKW